MAIAMGPSKEYRMSKYPITLIVLRMLPGYGKLVVHKVYEISSKTIETVWLDKVEPEKAVQDMVALAHREVETFKKTFVEFTQAEWHFMPVYPQDVDTLDFRVTTEPVEAG